jgi:hypothetical protein
MFWTAIGACVLFTLALIASHWLTYWWGHGAGRIKSADYWRPMYVELRDHCTELEHQVRGTRRPWMIRPLSPAELRRPQPNPRPTPEPVTSNQPRLGPTTDQFEALIDDIKAGTWEPPGQSVFRSLSERRDT